MNNFRANFALFVQFFFSFFWLLFLLLHWSWLLFLLLTVFRLLPLLCMCISSLVRFIFFIVLFYLLVLLPFCLYCVKQIENCDAIELRKRIFFIWSQCNIGGWSVISYIAHSMCRFYFQVLLILLFQFLASCCVVIFFEVFVSFSVCVAPSLAQLFAHFNAIAIAR